MKYTKEDVCGLSWKHWTETMAKELNANGYMAEGLHGSKIPFDGKDPKLFILGELGSHRREKINYLKELGLLNNGRCPLCGNTIGGEPGRFTSGFDNNSYFDICNDCAGSHGKGKVSALDQTFIQGGCLTTLLLFPIVAIVHRIKNKRRSDESSRVLKYRAIDSLRRRTL